VTSTCIHVSGYLPPEKSDLAADRTPVSATSARVADLHILEHASMQINYAASRLRPNKRAVRAFLVS
jgi:hypothetical protein